jgi:steroid delta-isomerase-like uncharacterized protein
MKNDELIHNFINSVINSGNLHQIDDFLSPSFQTHTLHMDPAPVVAGSVPKSFKEALIQLKTVFEDFERKIDDCMSHGEKVVIRWTTTAKHIGEYMGVPATNKHVSFSGISIYIVENGKIIHEWYVWDRLGLQKQLTEPSFSIS